MQHEKEPNWDQDMREVNRLLARLPDADPGLIGGPRKGAPGLPAGGAPERARRSGPLATWIKVGLGVVFAVAVWQWPYRNDCGSGLTFYLVGVGTVVVAGVWCLTASWRSRLAFAHLLALLVFLAGLVLAARVALPRMGYAAQPAVWRCATPAPPVPR